jgi:transcriptional regulator with XRE-family HTH domain
MQRTEPGVRTGYAARRLKMRWRRRAGPQPSCPAPMPHIPPYLVRVRNVPSARDTWATYVKSIRTATRLSRAEFARRLEVDPTTVWRWETGRQKPESPAVPEALAAMFHLELEDALRAAGLLPTIGPAPEPPLPPMDPDLKLLVQKLADPKTNEATKAFIRYSLRMLAALPDVPPNDPPRRRSRAS